MDYYWQKQTLDKPLYPDIIWSRPETKGSRGKLLIIGGNSQGFAVPVQAYSEAAKAGAGTVRVVLPEANRKYLSKALPEVEYAPNNSSGGFSREALGSFIKYANWADAVLLAGEMAHSSETAILVERFFSEYKGLLTITDDATDYALEVADTITMRPKTIFVVDLKMLQKLAIKTKSIEAFKLEDSLVGLVDKIHKFSEKLEAAIVIKHADNYIVAYRGTVGTIEARSPILNWESSLAVHVSVWALQNQNKLFEALNCAVFEIQNPGAAGEN